MKYLFSIMSVLLFAVVEVFVVSICQYLAVDGPDWLTIAYQTDSNRILAIIGIILTLSNLVIVVFLVNWIWDPSVNR